MKQQTVRRKPVKRQTENEEILPEQQNGTALAYRDSGEERCVELFEQVTDFFLDHLPADSVPNWDLDFTDGDGEPKDSSAGAIAVCGMLEMCRHLPDEKAEKYHAVRSAEESNGLLLHGVYAKNSPYNPIPKDRGVDECNTWGDYFYMEALVRVQRDWKAYW